MLIMERVEQIVDGIPVLLVMSDGELGGDVVLWMSHLGGSAEQTIPMARALRRCRALRSQL